MEDYFNNHDVLNDVRRLKKNCKNLDKEWDELKNTENKYIQPDYQRMLCLVLGKADEAYQQPQRKRERDNSINIVNIDDDEEWKRKSCLRRAKHQRGSGLCIRACDKGKNVVRGEQIRNDRPVTKYRLGRRRNVTWKDMVDGDNEDTLPMVRVKGKRVVDQVRLDEHNVKAQSSVEQERSDDKDVIMVETSSNEGGDDDVEILDDDAFRAISSFVPSKRFHKSIEGDDDKMDFHQVMSSASDAFRKQVVEVLKKPFDEEELKRLRKDVEDGSYYRHFPDLKSKLTSSRYKCLNILRGFLFWLQNVAQEGAFKPWKDGQCLAVMPGSPVNSPPP